MRNQRLAGAFLALVAVMLAVTGMAAADRLPNSTPESVGITSDTHIECVGTVITSSSLSAQVSTSDLNPPLGDSDAMSTTGYNENTMAVDGEVSYTSHFGYDSANKIADKNNLETQRIIGFDASKGSGMGRMTSTESVLIDNVGMPADAGSTMLCPFGSSSGGYSPAFCSIATAGSSLDITKGSVATQGSVRSVAATGDVPAALAYSISLRGLNDGEPAEGSVSAYIKVHAQDARSDSLLKSSDIQFEEMSSASGLITTFQKSMTYQSGMRRI